MKRSYVYLDVAVVYKRTFVVTPQIFQIDDGWQTHWGDWEGMNTFHQNESSSRRYQQSWTNTGYLDGPFYVSVDAIFFQNMKIGGYEMKTAK